MKCPISGGIFDAPARESRIEVLRQETEAPDFWKDPKGSARKLLDLKHLKNRYLPWKELHEAVGEFRELYELILEEGDESQEASLGEELSLLEKKFRDLKVLETLGEPTDILGAYLTIHAGAGGTEACDWAAMLHRMYSRWIEQKKFKQSIVDLNETEEGIKSISLQVTGDYANGLLRAECGIHRLVRISPFDSNSRRHTSFASVYVSPVIDDTIEVNIRPEDIRLDTYRASGAGGQHVNKTSSAIRMTHLETGIVVQCQNERSQLKNKELAMKVLRSKLYEYYRLKQEEEQSKTAAEKKEIAWGSQIRSYVFHPYTMVKDLRTRFETSQVQAVMDGQIDDFIEEYLKQKWTKFRPQ